MPEGHTSHGLSKPLSLERLGVFSAHVAVQVVGVTALSGENDVADRAAVHNVAEPVEVLPDPAPFALLWN